MSLQQLVNSRKKVIKYTEGQKRALVKVFRFLESKDRFFLLSGYSGCGKTTIAENIANYTKATLLAPTNAAKNRLVEKIDNPKIDGFTIHSYFSISVEGQDFDASKKLNRVLIVDECSMVDEYILDIIIRQALRKNSKVIFMGDSFQLEPVGINPKIFEWERSEKYSEHFLPHNRYELTEVKRYDGSLLKIATQLRQNKKPKFQLEANSDLSVLSKFSTSLVKDIKEKNKFIVLTSTNKKRVAYNHNIRAYKYKDAAISIYPRQDEQLVSIANTVNYCNGETFTLLNPVHITDFKITFKETEYDCFFYSHGNNQKLILIPELFESGISTYQLEKLAGEDKINIDESYFNQMFNRITNKYYAKTFRFNKYITIATYGYAISCHKAQGQEWDNVYIDGTWIMDECDPAKWFYTAITRAKNKVEVINNRYLKWHI